MNITIPDDAVPELLAGLRRVRTNAAVHWITSAIEKELQDEEEVNDAIETGDLSRLERLANTVSPGFNRFRVLQYLQEQGR